MSGKATQQIPRLVLIGANSNAGRALASLWPAERLVPVHRGGTFGVSVKDYRSVPHGAVTESSVVINCVGTPRGHAMTLDQINREVPLNWATEAVERRAQAFIQLSSFSVYGGAERIDLDTPEAPATDYGSSKLAADRELAAIDRGTTAIACLRIPMLFGEATDKLSQLVSLLKRSRMVPRPTETVARSMLGYQGLALALAHLARAPVNGILHFADPQPFTYDLLAACMHRAGQRVLRVPAPRSLTTLLQSAAPGLGNRLFASSVLSEEARLACELPAHAQLIGALDRLVRTGGYA